MNIENFDSVRVGHFDTCVDVQKAQGHESYATQAVMYAYGTQGEEKRIVVVKDDNRVIVYQQKWAEREQLPEWIIEAAEKGDVIYDWIGPAARERGEHELV